MFDNKQEILKLVHSEFNDELRDNLKMMGVSYFTLFGLSLQFMGLNEKSERYLSTALEIDPEQTSAKRLLEKAEKDLDDRSEINEENIIRRKKLFRFHAFRKGFTKKKKR